MEVMHSRLQHGVGQGSFHSAVIRGRGATGASYEFTYVYDCGAGRGKSVPSAIKNAVKRLDASPRTAKSKAGTIDLLVISHYDRDHINGAQYLVRKLNVSRILLPYLTPEDLLLVLASLAVEISSDAVRELYSLASGNSGSFFGVPTTFVRRGDRPDGDGARPGPNDEPMPAREITPRRDGPSDSAASMGIAKRDPRGHMISDISDIADDEEIVVGVPSEQPLWRLRFWNAGGNPALRSAVKKELSGTSFPLADLESSTGLEAVSTWFLKKENREEAFAAYRRAIESVDPAWINDASDERLSNLLSIGMYSGPDFEIGGITRHWLQSSAHIQLIDMGWWHDWESPEVAGWLGTGDAPLGQPMIWTDFEKHYSKEISQTCSFLVPHHGAAPKSGPAFYNAGLNYRPGMASVFSYGVTNSYGHPADSVVTRILLEDGVPVFVNEQHGASFLEVFSIESAL